MRRRILSILMAAAMVLSLLPATALADETWTKVSSAEDLSAALAAGGNIKLTGDITVNTEQSWTIGSGVTVVLDLNGHSITSTYNESNYFLFTVKGGTFTLNDSSEPSTGKIEIKDASSSYPLQLTGNGSTFTMNGGTIKAQNYALDIYSMAKNTTVTINGGTLSSSKAYATLGIRGSGTVVNITDGLIENTGSNQYGAFVSSGGSTDPNAIVFNMTGGKLTSNGTGILTDYALTVNIDEEAQIETKGVGVSVKGTTVLNVDGGSITSTGSYALQGSDDSSINVTGGSVKADSSYQPVVYLSDNSKAEISGGTITGSKVLSVGSGGSKENFAITGGTFQTSSGTPVDVSSYLPAGNTQNEDGTVVIADTAVAKIGNAGYNTLQDAITAAKDGDTVTMRKAYDTTVEGTITLNADKDVTLDLGEYELTLSRFDLVRGRLTVKNGSVASNPTNGQAFNVYAGPDATGELYTKLVIEDDVTINAAYGICLFPEPNSNAGYNSSIEVYGKIESGGIFVSGNLGNDTNTAGNMASSNKIPTITIHEGAVVSNGTEGQGIAMNGLANVTVEGGTITGSEAIGVKRGTLTVNGGTFTSNGEYVDPIVANNNGTENTGATISITSTYNYAGTINVNLNGGTFTSENAPAVYQGHSKSGETTNTYTQGVTLNIQGGTFTSPDNVPTVYVAANVKGDAEGYTKQVISGGTFSEEVRDYLASEIQYEVAHAASGFSYAKDFDAAQALAKQGDTITDLKATEKFTLTLKYNDGGATADSVYEVAENTKITLPAPSRTNYTFNGWYDKNNTKVESPYTVSKTETLTAQWSYNGGGSSGSTRYTVTAPTDVANGSVKVSPTRASYNQTVTVTVTPDEGYQLASIAVTDRSGNTITLERGNANQYTFKMPRGAVSIAVTFEEIAPWTSPYVDVTAGDWFYDAVEYVVDNGLMTGTSSTTFEPDAQLTRGMMATVLWAMSGGPVVNYAMDYTDVSDGDWYAEAVRWATSTGVVTGMGDGTYEPNAPITREQMMVMLYAYAVRAGYDVDQGGMSAREFDDYGEISGWAVTAMEWAVNTGMIGGKPGNILDPGGNATRAEVATILRNYHQTFVAE